MIAMPMAGAHPLPSGLLRLLAASAFWLPGTRGPGGRDDRTGATGLHARRLRRGQRTAAHVHAFVVRPAAYAGWLWRLERADGEPLAAAPRPVLTPQQARADTLRVRLAAATGPVETYDDVHGEVRWRLLSRAGAVLAVSAAGYATRAAAEPAITAFRREASHAELADD